MILSCLLGACVRWENPLIWWCWMIYHMVSLTSPCSPRMQSVAVTSVLRNWRKCFSLSSLSLSCFFASKLSFLLVFLNPFIFRLSFFIWRTSCLSYSSVCACMCLYLYALESCRSGEGKNLLSSDLLKDIDVHVCRLIHS